MPARKVTPDVDVASSEFNSFEFNGIIFHVKRKYKIGRFLKAIIDNPIEAIELALEPKSFDLFLDLEMSMDDLKEFMELMSNVMAGASLGN